MTSKAPVMGVTVGTLINDRYEILQLIGVGGFAAVFKAHDSQIERDVAIKVLNVDTLVSQGNDLDTVLARFSREAKTAASINHPCVVQIYDFGVLKAEDNPFIIMELLSGHDLKEEISSRVTLDPARFIPLFTDTLEALGEAHKLGIVHKDIKPSNLFLADPNTRRETLKLVDFGIAHIAQTTDERLTKTGYMLGTPQYMAPEYVEEQLVTPPLDVYQMGLLLVEMLAGQAVIQETNPWKCAMMHVSRELTVPVALLNSPLGVLLQKALALNPEDRYPNATEFADALALVDISQVPHLAPNPESRTLNNIHSDDDSPTQRLANPEPHHTPQRTSDPGSPTTDESQTPAGSGFTPKFATPDNSQHRTKIFVAVLLLGLTIALFVAILSMENQEDPEEPPLAANVEVEIPHIDRLNPQPSIGAEPDSQPSEPERNPEPDPIFVRLETIPMEASIMVDGDSVGTGLFELEFEDEDQAPFEISVSHDGYITKSQQVDPGTDSPLEIRLEREPTPPRAAAPTPPRQERPAPPPPREPAPAPEVEEEEQEEVEEESTEPVMQMVD